MAVSDQLDPVRADSLERVLVDSLLTDLADAKYLSSGMNVGLTVAMSDVCRRAAPIERLSWPRPSPS